MTNNILDNIITLIEEKENQKNKCEHFMLTGKCWKKDGCYKENIEFLGLCLFINKWNKCKCWEPKK
jgi:hypothetical protein